MTVADQIRDYVERLPASLQAEVLDFVEYLSAKSQGSADDAEGHDWTALSLAAAMRGMEDDDALTYTVDDIRVPYL